LIPDSEDDDTFDEERPASHDPSLISSGRTDLGLNAGQAFDPSAASTLLSQVTERHKCTRKHFRIKRIIGRQVIDNDAWYDVRWKRSWVPSHLVVQNEDGRNFIAIDGKDWYIKEIVKSKMKKGFHKQLVPSTSSWSAGQTTLKNLSYTWERLWEPLRRSNRRQT
jgi:hypothetical protein